MGSEYIPKEKLLLGEGRWEDRGEARDRIGGEGEQSGEASAPDIILSSRVPTSARLCVLGSGRCGRLPTSERRLEVVGMLRGVMRYGRFAGEFVAGCLVISEGADGPTLKIWIDEFSKIAINGAGGDGSEGMEPSSTPATPRESKICEAVMDAVAQPQCCSVETVG